MNKLLSAWTAPTSPYPEYLNISLDGDEVVVTVRAPATPEGNSGASASMRMPLGNFAVTLAEIGANLG